MKWEWMTDLLGAGVEHAADPLAHLKQQLPRPLGLLRVGLQVREHEDQQTLHVRDLEHTGSDISRCCTHHHYGALCSEDVRR